MKYSDDNNVYNNAKKCHTYNKQEAHVLCAVC